MRRQSCVPMCRLPGWSPTRPQAGRGRADSGCRHLGILPSNLFTMHSFLRYVCLQTYCIWHMRRCTSVEPVPGSIRTVAEEGWSASGKLCSPYHLLLSKDTLYARSSPVYPDFGISLTSDQGILFAFSLRSLLHRLSIRTLRSITFLPSSPEYKTSSSTSMLL